MPRRAKIWKPLPLSHDTAARADDVYQESNAVIDYDDLGIGQEDFVVFVETLDTLTRPRSMEGYAMDLFAPQAAKICLMRTQDSGNAYGRQAVTMCSTDDIPEDAAVQVVGSALKLPLGSDTLRSMLYFRATNSVFCAVLWCPNDSSWSHVATYRSDGQKIRIGIRPANWNRSATKLLNSHSSQFIGLRRLYRIGTGKVAHQDDFSLEPMYTDPFGSAMYMQETSVVPSTPVLPPVVAMHPQNHAPRMEERHDSALPLGFHYAPPIDPRTYTTGPVSSCMPISAYSAPFYGSDASSAYGGAVQWPQDYSMMQGYYESPAYAPMPIYYSSLPQTMGQGGRQSPDIRHDLYDERPTGARTVLRNTVGRLADQAKERNNKTPKEYRTVLYDPYRVENSTPLRGEAPGYTRAMYATPSTTVQSVGNPEKQGHTIAPLLPQAVSNLSSMSLEHSSPDTDWQALPPQTICVIRPSPAMKFTPQNFSGPFFAADLESPLRTQPRSKQQGKTHDEEINDWWWSGKTFARQEEYYQSLVAADKGKNNVQAHNKDLPPGFDLSRLLLPVLENLAAYVEGPSEKRRDYFSRWLRAPEWCCDRSAEGAKSYFDQNWGCPPARVGRDPRYQPMPREPRYGNRYGHIGSRVGRFAKG